MSDAVERLAQALRDLVNEAVQAAVSFRMAHLLAVRGLAAAFGTLVAWILGDAQGQRLADRLADLDVPQPHGVAQIVLFDTRFDQ